MLILPRRIFVTFDPKCLFHLDSVKFVIDAFLLASFGLSQFIPQNIKRTDAALMSCCWGLEQKKCYEIWVIYPVKILSNLWFLMKSRQEINQLQLGWHTGPKFEHLMLQSKTKTVAKINCALSPLCSNLDFEKQELSRKYILARIGNCTQSKFSLRVNLRLLLFPSKPWSSSVQALKNRIENATN